MMRKKLIAITLLTGSAFTSTANAADGTITFIGNILDTACNISPGSQTVAMGAISKSAFSGAGSTADPTKFSITLSSCPTAITSASVKFDGLTDKVNSSLLALTATSGTTVASGVGVGIYEADNQTIIPIGSPSADRTLSTKASTTFNFTAKYVATAAKVTAGSAEAVSDFTISYN